MKRMMRSLIPALAGSALRDIDDKWQLVLMLAEVDILMLALMQLYLAWIWTAAAGIKTG